MTLSVEHSPDVDRLSDYVLGLLPAPEARHVAAHIAVCKQCQRMVRQEREVGQLVRLTVQRAARPEPGRLERARPVRRRLLWNVRRSLALAGVLLILIVGGLALPGPTSGNTVWQQPVTMVSTPSLTPTQAETRTPTRPATATQVAEYEPIRTPLAPVYNPPPPLSPEG